MYFTFYLEGASWIHFRIDLLGAKVSSVSSVLWGKAEPEDTSHRKPFLFHFTHWSTTSIFSFSQVKWYRTTFFHLPLQTCTEHPLCVSCWDIVCKTASHIARFTEQWRRHALISNLLSVPKEVCAKCNGSREEEITENCGMTGVKKGICLKSQWEKSTTNWEYI